MLMGAIRWGVVAGALYASVGTVSVLLFLYNISSDFLYSFYVKLYYPVWFYFHRFMVANFEFAYHQHQTLGLVLDGLFAFVLGAGVGALLYVVVSFFNKK